MKSTIALLATAGIAHASIQGCTGKASQDAISNFYCAAVNKVLYTNVEKAGSYQAVSYMGSGGQCSYTDVPYSSGIGPFAEGVSFSKYYYYDDVLADGLLVDRSYPGSVQPPQVRRVHHRRQGEQEGRGAALALPCQEARSPAPPPEGGGEGGGGEEERGGGCVGYRRD